MTAAEHVRHEPAGDGHPLLQGAAPATVRDWLLPEDKDRFVAEYQAALDDARTSLQLAPVQDVVERWRQVAVLQSDPSGFRRAARAWAEMSTGSSPPEDEPLEVTRAKAGM